MTIPAGQHPAPLDQVHALMVEGELFFHLTLDHEIPADDALGTEDHQQATHRRAHGEEAS